MNPPEVRVFSRAGCHLCDVAVEMLKERRLDPKIVDIDADEGLKEKFGQCVPVVEIAGKIRFRGRVNKVLLERLLAQYQ